MFTCTLAQYVAYKTNVGQQFTPQKHYRLPHPSQGILGPAPAIYAFQPTTLPSAFSIMPSQDPTWNMDTDASSYLNFNASNLSIFFYKRLFSSVHVGDGKSIPVTNTGHSIIPSHHRHFHLHNVLDYLTRRILLRCDSSGDLYPVTQPPTPPIAFLSTSTSMWHQHLRHPVKNGTWLLIPRPAGVNMVRSIWLFKHKFHADRTLSRYKARLVANGSSQQLGVDFDETFSPVVKPATICTVLSLAVSRKWLIHQLDVKNAFLNGDLSETVYMHQLPSFVDARFRNHVFRLQRSLYGLKQAPRAWVLRFILSQRKYALQLLERAHMAHCNPSRTPVDTESKLGPKGVPVQDPTLYCSLVGGLQYLTFTRPDLSYVVQQVCLYMHDPREPHFAALKRILRYVRGIVDFGLQLYASATTSLLNVSTLSIAPVLKLNTVVLLTLSHRLHGFAIYSTKHIEIDIHFVRDMVTVGQVRVLHVPSRYQYADIFTKGLSSALFEEFRSSLSVRPSPAPTVGAY
ncbi:ribonuclease H-like domain-containing protein [Tanacetum coccineum]